MIATSGCTEVSSAMPAAASAALVDLMSGELEHRPQPLTCLAAVFYQQHTPGLRATFLREGHARTAVWRRHPPQPYRERAAVPLSIARRGHRALMQLDQVPDEGQPDAEAAARAIDGFVGLHIHIEDVGQQRRRDAEARVRDAQHGVGAVDAEPHLDAAAGRACT